MIRVNKTVVILFILLSLSIASFANSPSQEDKFLVLTDVHVDTTTKHVMAFSPNDTDRLNDLDAPTFKLLMASLVDGIKQGTIPKPKFILYLGDIVGHDRMSGNAVVNSETMFFNELTTAFPDIPILYTFGNNDSYQFNYGPFTSFDEHHDLKTPLTIAHDTGKWSDDFLSTGMICEAKPSSYPCIITENVEDGYYAAYLEPALRLITLNSVMFSPRSGISTTVIRAQLDWLHSQLQTAQDNHESVLLAMHIPPGVNVHDGAKFWQANAASEFLSLIQIYQQTIMGILAGHTHKDEIKAIQDSAKKNMATIYITAALSTSHGNTPSFRIFSYAREQAQWRLTDYDTYHFSEQANDFARITKLYNFRDYYCEFQTEPLLSCLKNLTSEKMERFFNTGNEHNPEKIPYPQHMILPTS